MPIVSLYGALVMYVMIPLLPKMLDIIDPLNVSRPMGVLYRAQYYVDPEEHFLYICLHAYSASFVTMTTIMATDSMFFCYLMHVCGVLAVIR